MNRLAQTAEAVSAEAVESIRTIAPHAVEALKLSKERYLVLVPKLTSIAAQIKAKRADTLAQGKEDRKALRGLNKQFKALKAEDDAEKFKALVVQMSEVGSRVKANREAANAIPEVVGLTNDAEATRDRIAEIDSKMPQVLADAFVQALVA